MHGVNQLKTNNIRPLGFRGNTRVQDRFLEATILGMSASPTASLSEGCTVNEQGGPQTLRKESICSGGPTAHTRVPVQSVHGSQKRWLSKTSDKPVPTRSICHLGTLQDGKHSSSRAPNPGGGLDGKNRSQGCILCSPNSQGPSTMATFSLARPGLPVLLPSIQPVLSPLGVHKDHTPNSGVAEATGSEIDCLHRRLSPFSSLQGGSPCISLTHDHCTASIGFLDQQREVHPSTLPGNRILRSDSSVSLSTPARTANAKIQGPAANTQGCLSSDHYSKRIYWDSQCCSSGDTTRPTILQVPPGIQTPFSETGRGEQVNLWNHRSLVAPVNWIIITSDASI